MAVARSERQQVVLQDRMVDLVRAFGLHRPDRTPCGRPVSLSEAHALTELAADGGLSQSHLAARLRLEKSTVSRLVGALARRGWVARHRDASDGRAVRLALTPSGERAAAEVLEARRHRFAALLARVPADERDGVLRALDTLVEAMGADA